MAQLLLIRLQEGDMTKQINLGDGPLRLRCDARRRLWTAGGLACADLRRQARQPKPRRGTFPCLGLPEFSMISRPIVGEGEV